MSIFREYTKHAEDFFQTPGASANAAKSPASDDDKMEDDDDEDDEEDHLPILAGRRRLQRRVDDSELGSNGS